MLYALRDEIELIEPNMLTKLFEHNVAIAACLDFKELDQYSKEFGISEEVMESLARPSIHFRTASSLTESFIYGSFHLVDVENIMESEGKIAIFISSQYVLIVNLGEKRERSEQLFESAVARLRLTECSVERFLYLFLDCLVANDNVALEDIEFELDLLEDRIVAKSIDEDFYKVLIHKKRELFVLHNYYEQFLEFIDVLEENEFGIFANNSRKYLRKLDNRIGRLKQNTLLLRESLVQLREAYQSYLDYSLNNVMKIFTVVTTIFLPLTLIAGWYGMNFKYMPELSWRYGYVAVIVLSILVVLLCIWMFKKKKLI